MKPNKKTAYTAKPQAQTLYRPYAYPAGEGPVAVKDYLIKDMRNGRFCFLRFAKQSEHPVENIDLDLIELDAQGKEIQHKRVTLPGKHMPNTAEGELLTPRCGILVDEKCVAVQVILREITSGQYVYHIENDCAVAEYMLEEAWRYRQRERNEISFWVSSKRPGAPVVTRILMAVTLLVLAGILAAPYIQELLSAVS